MKKKLLILIAVIGVIAFVYSQGLTKYLDLSYIKENLSNFQNYYQAQPVLTIGVFALIYIGATALSIPGATILTLTAGALFGLLKGVIIVSFASSIGATISFLVSRYLLRDSLQSKYGDKIEKINQGIKEDGASYLFTLRLLPVFPFFLVNILMGLSPIKTSTFYIISQIGMLAGTAVYVNAGSQLSQIESLKGIMSPGLIASFVLLGLFPFIVKFIMKIFKANKAIKS